MTKSTKKPVQVLLDEDLHRRFKVALADQETTMQRLLLEMIEKWCDVSEILSAQRRQRPEHE